jgi:hypothetical protein
MHATAVTFALFFWVPSLCEAATFSEGRSHNDDTVTNSGLLTQPPSASPWSSQPNTSGNTSDAEPGETSSEKWGGNATSGLDVLIAAFFLIAATWLVLALIYSILVLIVVRMRARGRLDVYDESFGRFYLLGTRYYIPFGCVLRRYVIAMNQERTRDGEPVTVRLMTREERRMAMERLLDADHGQKEITEASETNNRKEESKEGSYANESTVVQPEEPNIIENHATDVAIEEEPVCTICLTEYEPDDVCFTSSVCSHEFHRTCILEWLERRANTECPCCRTSLVSDGQVWEAVQEMREERRRQIRKANRRGFFSRFAWRRKRDQSLSEGEDQTVFPTPPTSPTALTSFGSGDETQSESNFDVIGQNGSVSTNLESTQTTSSDLEAGRRLSFDE